MKSNYKDYCQNTINVKVTGSEYFLTPDTVIQLKASKVAFLVSPHAFQGLSKE